MRDVIFQLLPRTQTLEVRIAHRVAVLLQNTSPASSAEQALLGDSYLKEALRIRVRGAV